VRARPQERKIIRGGSHFITEKKGRREAHPRIRLLGGGTGSILPWRKKGRFLRYRFQSGVTTMGKKKGRNNSAKLMRVFGKKSPED